MSYNAKKELKRHREEFGSVYLVGGQSIRVKDEELKRFLKDRGLTIQQPIQQPTFEELKANIWYFR